MFTRNCVCIWVSRCGLHYPDAAGQFELLHQPLDLHSFLQQRVPRAAEPAPLWITFWSQRLAAGRLYHHHTQLHHQGQHVLTETDGGATHRHVCEATRGCAHTRSKDMPHRLRTEQADLHQMFPPTEGQVHCQQDF